jgi:hypothetical protein
MTLVLQAERDGPQTHALIVGIGAYPNLAGRLGPPTTKISGLDQLSSPPLSALLIADWLRNHFRNPSAPLGSLDLLVSATEGPIHYDPRDGSEAVEVAVPTIDALRSAVRGWFERANDHADSITLLYICGHGLTLDAETLLLAADFGASQGDGLEKAFALGPLLNAMGACAASRQVYFIDASRGYFPEHSASLLGASMLLPTGRPLAASPVRQAVYYATAVGQPSFASRGQPSLFSKSLVDAFVTLAASRPGQPIDTLRLGNALDESLRQAAASAQVEQIMETGPMTGFNLHHPDALDAAQFRSKESEGQKSDHALGDDHDDDVPPHDSDLLHVEDDAAPRDSGLLDVDSPADAPPRAAARGLAVFGIRFNREPDERAVALGVNIYAPALATLFKMAKGEFCFGLYGRWGIGKTFLSKYVAILLTDAARYRAALSMPAKRSAQEPSEIDSTYAVVTFSAWQYPRKPELWIFLYETFADAFTKPGPVRSLPRLLRCGVARHGYRPLVVGLLSLGLLTMPFGSQIGLFRLIVPILGLGGLWYGWRLISRARATVGSLAARYASLARHHEHLGMQALIGAELRRLLLGWMPRKHFSLLKTAAVAAPLFAFFFLAFFLLPSGGAENKSVLSELCGRATGWDECKAFAWSAPPELYQGALALWGAFCLTVLGLLHVDAGTPDRVLLVIDDLDRLDARELVDTVESIKLLLESDDVKDRVQVMMLIDEEILEHAIISKFDDFIKSETSQRLQRMKDAVVEEHLEKLFACHLRLPGLTPAEVADLTERYSDLENEPAAVQRAVNGRSVWTAWTSASSRLGKLNFGRRMRRRKRTEQARGEPPSAAHVATVAGPPQQSGAPETLAESRDRGPVLPQASETPFSAPTMTPTLEPISGTLLAVDMNLSKFRFQPSERDQLKAALKTVAEKKGVRVVSPRMIRAFLYKYQLARLLLRLSGQSAVPDEIAPRLAQATIAGRSPAPPAPTERIEVDSVVRHVT